MIDSLVVFLMPLWCIHILSRRVRFCLNIKKKQTLFSCVNNRVSQIYCLCWWCQHIQTYTHIDKQTNKQIRYCRSVLLILSLCTTIELDRHSSDPVPERVHYIVHIPVYISKMAIRHNLRFRIQSRTQQRCWAGGALYTYA